MILQTNDIKNELYCKQVKVKQAILQTNDNTNRNDVFFWDLVGFNPLTLRRTQVSPFIEISILF